LDFNDQELVSEIRSGSGIAFERLMQRYGRLVHRIAFGFTGDVESAMDVAQDTFLKVHARLETWRGEGDLKNWIARIAAHEAMNRKRSGKRHPTCELDEEVFLRSDPSPEDDFNTTETQQALHRSLTALQPRQRLAVVLRYFQGMSTREISTVLECSDGTARNILFRSLRKLRSNLTHSEETIP
jgi:RNA polymerase sigma-70 factor (ECF subfamily)